VVADNVYYGESKRDSESGAFSPQPRDSAPGFAPPPSGDQFAELDGDDGDLPF
jgi:single-strand DNA-binding protein